MLRVSLVGCTYGEVLVNCYTTVGTVRVSGVAKV